MRLFKVMAIGALALAGASVQAKDEHLESAMIGLEKAYINPLFFTSNMNAPKSKATMATFVSAWNAFSATYRHYRPSERNWVEHFDTVDEAIARAQPIVSAAVAACPVVGACPSLVTAHDHLEAVRYAMRELRIHNGFPKFITDKLTAYHDPMEAVVLTLKGRSVEQVTAADLAFVGENLEEARALWTLVEKTPIDATAWGFGAAQMAAIDQRISDERAILELLASCYDAGDVAGLVGNALALKAKFVPVYTAFAGDPALNKLPQ
jgi:hypothetical protein